MHTLRYHGGQRLGFRIVSGALCSSAKGTGISKIRQKPTIGYASMTFTKLLINLDLVMSSSFRFSVPQAGQ